MNQAVAALPYIAGRGFNRGRSAMPITPTLTVDPTVMTNNWSAGVSNPVSGQKLLYKYNHPKRAFNFNPAQQQADYATGVQRAIAANKYAAGMQAADLNQASANMQSHGITNWQNSATTKKYKYQRKANSLAAAINTVLASVEQMPKGRGANNRARAMAWFDQMSAFYGKISAG
jgi:hypothetical protein